MTQLDKLKDRAKVLEAKDPKAAVDAWLEVLKLQDAEGDPNADLGLYNRIGDLYLKLRDPGSAADYYDRAVDKYAELGFHNNAIAMCNKVLRNAPARQGPYLKLARLYAAKGFLAEAKQNFVEYAERMQKAGKIEQAFAALKSVTDLSPESEGLRHMLEEHLKMYGEVQRRPSVAKPAVTPDQGDITKSGKRKTSSLVFLDLDEPAKPKEGDRKSAGTAAPARPTPAPAKPAAPTPPIAPPAPPKRAFVKDEADEDDDEDIADAGSIEIERTSLSDDGSRGGASLLEGFETTSADFGDTRSAAADVPSIRDDPTADDVEPAMGLEPTDVGASDLGLLNSELTVEEELAPPPPPPAPKLKPSAKPAPPPPPPPPPAKSAPAAKPPVKPAAKPPEKAPEPPRRRTQVEVPPLELEPDFESTTHAGHHVDDQPLAIEEPEAADDWVETEDDAAPIPSSGFIDLGVDGIVNQEKGALMFSGIEDAPAAPSIGALEERVADNPDDPEAHQALGEALIEAGQRDRGIEELDIATNGFETAGNLQQARDLVDEILRLDPNSVRHRQKCVEFSFKAGDKAKLIDAYLELADTLLRGDLPDKAQAVYQRVAEHDPGNPRVRAALAMLAPAPSAPAAGAKGKEGRVPAKDAKMTVRDSTVDTGDFVDLGSLVMDEDHADRDTRMKVQDEEPTGDEEKDFQEMLARFKQGIDENIDEADFQSHYDLGVAFKEMGLLDEAISEFQRALRAPEGKLRTSEALGACFFEKGAFGVTESILRRALDLPASGDQERLGILYWLGRSLEEQGKGSEARELYGRVFAVEIRFRDVGERVKALAKAR